MLKNCLNCSKEFTAETKEVNRGYGKFCSRICSGKYNSNNRNKSGVVVDCSFCSKEFYISLSRKSKSKSGNYYCSREHSIEGSRLGKHKTGPESITNSSCSTITCKNKTRSLTGVCRGCTKKDKIYRWLLGDLSVTWVLPTKEPKTFVKEFLKEIRGDWCEECGYEGKRPDGSSKVQMDHIDGNYTNNSIDNLRLLCPNCHEDTPTMGSRNNGNGRSYRVRGDKKNRTSI